MLKSNTPQFNRINCALTHGQTSRSELELQPSKIASRQKWLTRATLVLNSQDREVGLNLRLNYILQPSSDLFVVYNEGREYGDQGGLQDRALIVKMTYSLDY